MFLAVGDDPFTAHICIGRHFDIDESIIRLIPADVARKYQFIPVSKTGATLTDTLEQAFSQKLGQTVSLDRQF